MDRLTLVEKICDRHFLHIVAPEVEGDLRTEFLPQYPNARTVSCATCGPGEGHVPGEAPPLIYVPNLGGEVPSPWWRPKIRGGEVPPLEGAPGRWRVGPAGPLAGPARTNGKKMDRPPGGRGARCDWGHGQRRNWNLQRPDISTRGVHPG
eukprot:gene18169-biopygen862